MNADPITGFRFVNYDTNELAKCGEEFERAFRKCGLSGNCEWTPAIFRWFRQIRAEGVHVYPEPDEGEGEFIVDHCHTTYPFHGEDSRWPSPNYYKRAFEGLCEIKLALESERGKWANSETSLAMVLDDACKLAVLRAKVKVMIFASHPGKPDSVPEALAKLRKCHQDTVPWLWIDVPNEPRRPTGAPRGIRHGLLVD